MQIDSGLYDMQNSHPNTPGQKPLNNQALIHILPWAVFSILLLYTYAKFFEHPYYGFRWDAGTQEITTIYTGQDGLQVKDRIIQIGPMNLVDFESRYWSKIYMPEKGEIIPVIMERNGQELTVPWKTPGPNPNEIFDLLFNESWIAIAFWGAGTLALFNLRPMDERWQLMIAFNYLTALWLILGSGLSHYHIWGSNVFLRIAVWFCLPVYLHLHWVFPKPLSKLPPRLVQGVYAVVSLVAIAECFQLLPDDNTFLTVLALAFFASLALLFIHGIFQREARRELRILGIAAVLALVPAIIIGIIGSISGLPALAGGALLSLPLLPFAYFYTVYRRQLGGLEIRINRIISIYIFLSLLLTLLATVIVITTMNSSSNEAIILASLGSSLFAVIMAFWGFPIFQTFVENRILGLPIPKTQLPDQYSTRILTSNTISHLLRLLTEEILPSLVIRQFVFLKVENSAQKALLTVGLKDDEIREEYRLSDLTASMGNYIPDDLNSPARPHAWVRLILPLKIGDAFIGLWLFGRRDPDDLYSQAEISILQTLANQTAIALSYVLQTEQLKSIYQDGISRYEDERMRLALILHDSILNELAVLRMNLSEAETTPAFQQAYEKLKGQIREIIVDLRPPMLDYGLKPAIEELGTSLMERSNKKIKIIVEIETDDSRYQVNNVEEHIFRIVQEACENAARHAQAKIIRITGRLFAGEISLSVTDDGIGFETRSGLGIDTLVKQKHFGLAGILKRAQLIGAEASIHSEVQKGTGVQIILKPNDFII